jgi:hypothetical protein
MKLRFAIVVLFVCSFAYVSHAQTTPPPVAKPTMADVNKVTQIIRSDETKLAAYCEIGKVNQQMVEANEKKDAVTLQQLDAKVDQLEQSLGPEYEQLMIGLEQVDRRQQKAKQWLRRSKT